MSILDKLWESSLFEAIWSRRSFRFGLGMEMNFDAMPYKSEKEPVPLSELETAILCAVAAGTTGVVTGDNIPLCVLTSFEGRTIPTPCNTWAYALFFTNDEGTFYYRPPKPTKVWEIDSLEDREKILDWFKTNTVKIGDPLDVPKGPPALMSSNKWNILRPGSTTFIFVADNTHELINGILFTCSFEDRYKYIDDETGKPAGCEKWIKNGWLNGPEAPVSLIENMLCVSNAVSTAAMMQNILLAMAAMGLGGLPYAGYAPLFVFGGTPFAKGLGFRFLSDKKGMPNPVGKDGLFEALCPPYKSMSEAVDMIVQEKWNTNGMFSDKVMGIGPYKDYAKIKSQTLKTPPEAIECTKDILNYVYDKYGRLPSHFDTMMIPVAVQTHHVEEEFYQKYTNIPLTKPIKNHMKEWHEK